MNKIFKLILIGLIFPLMFGVIFGALIFVFGGDTTAWKGFVNGICFGFLIDFGLVCLSLFFELLNELI